MDLWDYRFSRSTDSANAPLEFRWAVIDDDPKMVWREMVTAIASSVKPQVIPDVIGSLKALIRRIELGAALDPHDVQNLERDRDLFELRLQLPAFGLLMRIYTAEPSMAPKWIVALRAHNKIIDDDKNARQDQEIDIASDRYQRGVASLWGLN